MNSTTKAGIACQLMHQNDDFGSAMLYGVANNDTDAVRDALDIVDLGLDAFTLTDKEMEDLMRGVTPSGALEITSWEGYYVSSPLANGDKYALFITSANNCVYWGLENKLMDNFTSYRVSYQLPNDGTLRFSSSAGDVVLALSRDYSLEKVTVSVGSFKGTIGAESITGAHALPPWPSSDTVLLAATTARREVHAADDNNQPWYEGNAAVEALAILGIIGGLVNVLQCIGWVVDWIRGRSGEAKARSDALMEGLRSVQTLALDMAGARVNIDVNWAGKQKEITTHVTQELNSVLRNRQLDWTQVDPQAVVESLRENTKNTLREELNKEAKRVIQSQVSQQTSKYAAYPDYNSWVTQFTYDHVTGVVEQTLAKFDFTNKPEDLDMLTGSVVYDARATFFSNEYDKAVDAIPNATVLADEAKGRRLETEGLIRDIDADIAKDRQDNDVDKLKTDLERRNELDGELTSRKDAEAKANGELSDLREKRGTSDTKQKDSEGERGRAEAGWDKAAEGVFGK